MTEGGKMDKEVVREVINQVSAGNSDLRWLLGEIYADGKGLIDRFPNEQKALVTRKMIHAASWLVKRQISPTELLSKGEEYWRSERGKVTAQRISEYRQGKEMAVRARQTANQGLRTNA